MIAFQDFFSISYWLTPNPGTLGINFSIAFAVLFGFFLLVKIVLRYMGRQYIVDLPKYKKAIAYRIESLFLIMGILGFVWLFLAYEMIPFFSGRFMFVAWVITVIIWAYQIFYYARYEVPGHIEREKNRQEKKKYFSKK